MNNLREIKGRLRSIRKNKQILGAMKMVSAVKLRRIQAVFQVSQPYALCLETLLRTLLALPEVRAFRHPLMAQRKVRRTLWVVLSTDRGLCGSLNTNLFRFVQNALHGCTGAHGAMALLLIGRKAGDFFKRLQVKSRDFQIEQAYPLDGAQAESMVRHVCDLYRNGQVDQVDLFYAQYKSPLLQVPVKVPLLPMAPFDCRPCPTGAGAAPVDAVDGHSRRAWIFEPSPAAIADDLLPRCLISRVSQILLEQQIAEHGARMIMMDQASKNASDMIGQIQLDYNTLRQLMITGELADITTGVEAMA